MTQPFISQKREVFHNLVAKLRPASTRVGPTRMSRFWPAASWQPGRPQHAFDKQIVRDWSRTLAWDRTAPGPAIPPDIVEATRQRYIEAYQHITGTAWPSAG